MKTFGGVILGPLLLILFMIVPVSSAVLPAQLLEGAVGQLESYFPAVEGYVVSLVDDLIYTDIPASSGLQPGSEMTLFREGKEILHPLTGQAIGRYETLLGTMKVRQVREDYSSGNLIWGGDVSQIRPGDRVRITSSRLKVAVPSPIGEALGEEEKTSWQSEVFLALERSARFSPMDLRKGLSEPFLDQEEKIRALAYELQVDALLGLDVTGTPHELYLTMSLYSGSTGGEIAVLKVPVEETRAAVLPVTGVPRPFAPVEAGIKKETEGFSPDWESFYPGHAVEGLCSGSLTGEPGGQLAVTDGRALYIYARSASGWQMLWQDEGRRNMQILTVDCGDIDGNGLEELFVTRISTGHLRSKVLEYQGGLFSEKTGEKNLFYRTVRTGIKSWRLYAQRYNADDISRNPIEEYTWTGGGYEPKDGGTLGFPTIHGFGLADIDGDGEFEFLRLDDHDYLGIYRESGDFVWKSDDRFGGSALFVDAETLGQQLPENEVGGYVLKGRILGFDVNGDGKWELILKRNIPKMGYLFHNIRIYDRSTLGFYRWNGERLESLYPPQEFGSYLADYALHVDEKGRGQLIIGFNEGSSLFNQGKGKLLGFAFTFPSPPR